MRKKKFSLKNITDKPTVSFFNFLRNILIWQNHRYSDWTWQDNSAYSWNMFIIIEQYSSIKYKFLENPLIGKNLFDLNKKLLDSMQKL